jgi:CRP-like cAMP-binding protein
VTDPRARLRELEKRLKDEPENLGLRVMVAGVLRDAGRGDDAVELYRSVAIAYRDQGRSQQAIAVCKSILEVAPDDKRCHALLETLVAKPPVEADDIEPLPPEPETPRRTGPHAVVSAEPTPKPIVAKEPETPRLEPPPPRLRATSSTPPTPPTPVPSPPKPAATPKTPLPSLPKTPPLPTTPLPSLPKTPPASTGPVPKTPVPGTPQTPRPGSIIAVGTTPPTKRRAVESLGSAEARSDAKRRGESTEPANEVRKKADSGTAHVIRREDSAPVRRSPFEETPLPKPMPHHVADPTTSNLKKLSESDLPVSEGAETRPGAEPSTRPEVTGIANAARRISASLIASTDASGLLDLDEDDLSAQLDTRQMPRIESSEIRKIDAPPPTVPTERIDLILEEITPPPLDTPVPPARDSDDERTRPRDLPFDTSAPVDDLATCALFVSLPSRQRAAVLARFLARSVKAGVAVIRQGETGHPLVVVARGKLNMICERIDGTILPIGSVGPGEFVGEAALLAHVPSPVQVVAATDVALRVLPAKELYEIAGAFPSMWTVLREAADRRTRELEVKLRR